MNRLFGKRVNPGGGRLLCAEWAPCRVGTMWLQRPASASRAAKHMSGGWGERCGGSLAMEGVDAADGD